MSVSTDPTETDRSRSWGGDPDSREPGSGRAFWILLFLLVAAVSVLIAIQWTRPKPPDPFAGQPLPPLQVSGWINADKPLTAADLAGKIVLVDYWATWCGPCVRAMPEVVRFNKRYHDLGVKVIGFTAEDGPGIQHVKNYVESKDGIDWPIAYGAGPTFDMMNVEGIPTYVLYGRNGMSVWGGHSMDGVDDALAAALANK
jgi:thiol-disulfide isomerase/thioredoxin